MLISLFFRRGHVSLESANKRGILDRSFVGHLQFTISKHHRFCSRAIQGWILLSTGTVQVFPKRSCMSLEAWRQIYPQDLYPKSSRWLIIAARHARVEIKIFFPIDKLPFPDRDSYSFDCLYSLPILAILSWNQYSLISTFWLI